MSSFFTLWLDTTPPQLEVVMPSYTLPQIYTQIDIYSNEILSSYQEIYLIDSNGDRFDYTFANYGDRLQGTVRFNNVAIGMATMYIRLKDEVGNISDTYIKNILIRESGMLKIEKDVSTRKIDKDISTRIFDRDIHNRTIENNLDTRFIDKYLNTRIIQNFIEQG